jgi:hypothetical protein
VRQTPFPEPAVETAYPTGLAARHAIVDQLRRPLGSLPEADRAFIDALLGETLDKTIIAGRIHERFQVRRGQADARRRSIQLRAGPPVSWCRQL